MPLICDGDHLVAQVRVLTRGGQVAGPVREPVQVGLRAEEARGHERARLGALGLAPGVAQRAVEGAAERPSASSGRRSRDVRAGRVEHALRVGPADRRDARIGAGRRGDRADVVAGAVGAAVQQLDALASSARVGGLSGSSCLIRSSTTDVYGASRPPPATSSLPGA